MRRLTLVIGVAIGILGLLVLAGAAGDPGCGGGVKTAKELCQDTGGTWDDSSCPPACWPSSCGEPVDKMCAAVCGSQPICKCMQSAPYWEDGKGCLAATQCPSPPSCSQAGGQCGPLVGAGVQCPAQHPTSAPAAGTCPQGAMGAACCL